MTRFLSTTTTVTKVVGSYTGQRISGTSNDVIEVIITTVYNFEGFSISVAEIPASLDQETGRYYLSGRVALPVNDKVNKAIKEVESKRQTGQGEVSLLISLDASAFLADAVWPFPQRV